MHESKIPQKIELFLAGPSDETRARSVSIDDSTPSFRRLGYITLDNNENSNNCARELKSISLGNGAVSRVKLLIHSSYDIVYRDDEMKNKASEGVNPLRQVGIISIALFGRIDMSSTNSSMLLSTNTKVQIPKNSETYPTSRRSDKDYPTAHFRRLSQNEEYGKQTKQQSQLSSKLISAQALADEDILSSLAKLEKLKHEMAEKEVSVAMPQK